MDSPPTTENNNQFIVLSDVFRKGEVPVPSILAFDSERGYLIVDDVGSEELLACFRCGLIQTPMKAAVETILKIQRIEHSAIPDYTSERLRNEIGIFEDFVCAKLLDYPNTPLQHVATGIVSRIDALPRVTVHRDFHCRNLLWRAEQNLLGVVDFQDALFGPVSYDLASLLFDCYWEHSSETIRMAVDHYWVQVQSYELPSLGTKASLFDAIRLTAIQRLLKAAGIFVRLWIQKSQTTHIRYVLPTVSKAVRLCSEFSQLQELNKWLSETVVPGLSQKLPNTS